MEREKRKSMKKRERLIRVKRISIYSMFLRCLCNLNARFTPLCAKITLIPHLCEFCRY